MLRRPLTYIPIIAVLCVAALSVVAAHVATPSPPALHATRQTHSAPVVGVSHATAVDRIVVDPAAPVRAIPPGFFGINVSAFWDPDPLSKASAIALRQTPIRTLRYPGGVIADWYDWQDPYYKGWSKTSPAQAVAYGRSFGATSFVFGTDYKDNIGTVPKRGYKVNSAANAAAWVESNQANHINALMEVGNEEDGAMHSKDDSSFAPYIAGFNQQARAMHRADPGVRVAGPVGTNEYYWWALDSLGQFLAGTGNRTGSGQVDAVSLHFYHGSSWYDTRGNAQYWLGADGPWANIERMIREHDTRHLPVYITEWNAGAGDSNNAFNPTLGHGLVVADMLGAFALSGVAGEDYWELHGSTGWGMFYGAGDTKPIDTPTPAYYAQVLWGHMGRTLLRLTQDDDAATATSAYATSGAGGSYQVLVINKQSHARRVSIALDGATPRGHRLSTYTLRGTSGHHWDTQSVYDGVKQPSPNHALPGPAVRTLTGNTIDATIPPYSAVVLSVDGTSSAPRLAPTATPNPNAPPTPTVTAGPSSPLSASGSLSATQARAGDTVTVAATVKANDDVGPALVDLELYDATGTKMWQETQDVTLAAGQQVTVKKPWRITSDTYGGTYTLKVGVFTPGWGYTFAWVDKAGQVTVNGPPSPTVSVTGEVASGLTGGAAHPGDTLTLAAHVSSAKNKLTGALLDFELYNPSGTKVCQAVASDLAVPRDGTVSMSKTCTIPASAATGDYVYKIGVFTSDWGHLYVWNNSAATFKVTR